MAQPIGELIIEDEKPLLKMWSIDVKPGSRPFIKHSHSRFEITVVNSGSGKYSTEKAVYPMVAGDVFVFASNEVHCITNVDKDGLSITNLHFEPRYLALKEDVENCGFLQLCFSHSEEFQNRIPFKKAETIRTYHNNIKKEFEQNGELLPKAIESYLNLILIELIRNQNYRSNTLDDTKNYVKNMLYVYEYIEHHLCETITLNQLADMVSLTPNYFSYLFKKLNGVSLCNYINAKRIEKATKLITAKDHELSMLEIATNCGFNNTANFNKTFKKFKGFTPSELKKDPKLLWH